MCHCANARTRCSVSKSDDPDLDISARFRESELDNAVAQQVAVQELMWFYGYACVLVHIRARIRNTPHDSDLTKEAAEESLAPCERGDFVVRPHSATGVMQAAPSLVLSYKVCAVRVRCVCVRARSHASVQVSEDAGGIAHAPLAFNASNQRWRGGDAEYASLEALLKGERVR
jgi:hypothetical protein